MNCDNSECDFIFRLRLRPEISRSLLSLAFWWRVWLIEELASWPTDWLNDWLTKIWFSHDELINSIYDHKKTQRNADVSSVSSSSKFSLRPRLQGSAQIFERTKTCTDPPFVYTGPAEPCPKLLNGKVCKFLTWSEVGQKFLTGSTFLPASRGLFSKNQGKDTSARRESTQFTRTTCKHTWTMQVFAQFAR